MKSQADILQMQRRTTQARLLEKIFASTAGMLAPSPSTCVHLSVCEAQKNHEAVGKDNNGAATSKKLQPLRVPKEFCVCARLFCVHVCVF